MRPRVRTLARVVLLGGGLVLLSVLVARHDPAALARSIAEMGWRLVVVVTAPFALVNLLDTLGWRFAFSRDRVPLRWLYTARLAGEAVNLTTPTASLGGEPVKAWLVRRWAPFEESGPSVVVAKTTITIGQGLFMIVGIGAAWWALAHETLLRAMVVLLAVEVVAVGVFVVAQVGGLFRAGGRLLRWLNLRGGRTLGRLDVSLGRFYRGQPARVSLSIGCHFLGWLAGVLEAWAILAALGLPVSLATATVIEAVSAGVRFATFMVPASLGFLEGGQVATFTALGLGGPAGLAFSLVRRIREITWIAAGYVALAAFRDARPAPLDP